MITLHFVFLITKLFGLVSLMDSLLQVFQEFNMMKIMLFSDFILSNHNIEVKGMEYNYVRKR